MSKRQKSLKSLVRALEEAGYAGQGHGTGAESFYGDYFGFGGDKQLAKKPIKAVRDLKAQEDDEAWENMEHQQQRNRGYPAAVGYAGGDGHAGPGSGARIPNTINQIGKSAAELDAMYVPDPKKDYWGKDDRELDEQGFAGGGGPGRSVASDGNYRNLPGFPRHNSLEYQQDHVPELEGDIDGDGEEDEYLSDDEYVNDVMRLNGLDFAPGSFKRLFGVSTLEESKKSKTAVIIKGNPKYIKGNPEADAFYSSLKDFLESEGYEVKMDPGKAYTSPPKADLWVGHSRGVDRLRFAPNGTKTVALGSHDGISHPKDNSLSLDGKPPKDFKPNRYHFILTDEMKKALTSEKIEEQGAYTSPGYGPEPDRGTERYKQGKTIEDHEPDATKKLIKPVDYTGGHADMAAAEHSPGAQAYGQIGAPKNFVPDDWEQRSWKTKEEAPMDMSQLEELIQLAVKDILEERRVMSSKNLLKKLKKNKVPGCDHIRQKGSHATFRCDVCQTVVPVHGSQDIKPGTLHSIEKDLEPCLGHNWLDEAIDKIESQELGEAFDLEESFDLEEAFTGIHDETGEGRPEGGSAAFRKNREAVLNYDKKQRPKGTEDLENYHFGED